VKHVIALGHFAALHNENHGHDPLERNWRFNGRDAGTTGAGQTVTITNSRPTTVRSECCPGAPRARAPAAVSFTPMQAGNQMGRLTLTTDSSRLLRRTQRGRYDADDTSGRWAARGRWHNGRDDMLLQLVSCYCFARSTNSGS
jgi:hypothetical protein